MLCCALSDVTFSTLAAELTSFCGAVSGCRNFGLGDAWSVPKVCVSRGRHFRENSVTDKCTEIINVTVDFSVSNFCLSLFGVNGFVVSPLGHKGFTG